MLHELTPTQYDRVLPLYARGRMDFPLIRAVIEHQQRGQIFVDRAHEPYHALVVTRFGFMFLFGDRSDDAVDRAITDLLFHDPRLDDRYLLWYDPPARFHERLRQMPDTLSRERERVQFHFDDGRFRALARKIAPLPAAFRRTRLDADLLPKTVDFKLDIGQRFWDSPAQFLRDGLGWCVIDADHVASVCYAACVVHSTAEIDVATHERYRGLGLATHAAAAFIEDCLTQSIVPNWDCFVKNEASYKLARRLGFEERIRYPFFTLNRLGGA